MVGPRRRRHDVELVFQCCERCIPSRRSPVGGARRVQAQPARRRHAPAAHAAHAAHTAAQPHAAQRAVAEHLLRLRVEVVEVRDGRVAVGAVGQRRAAARRRRRGAHLGRRGRAATTAHHLARVLAGGAYDGHGARHGWQRRRRQHRAAEVGRLRAAGQAVHL